MVRTGSRRSHEEARGFPPGWWTPWPSGSLSLDRSASARGAPRERHSYSAQHVALPTQAEPGRAKISRATEIKHIRTFQCFRLAKKQGSGQPSPAHWPDTGRIRTAGLAVGWPRCVLCVKALGCVTGPAPCPPIRFAASILPQGEGSAGGADHAMGDA